MESKIKILGEKGGQLVDGSLLGSRVYFIHVLEDAEFTVLNEKDKTNDTPTDVMSNQNLTGKTVPAGAQITPRKTFFSDITITSGKLYVYFDS